MIVDSNQHCGGVGIYRFWALRIDYHFFRIKAKNPTAGVDVGGVKRGHTPISTFNVDMVDVYEVRVIFDFEPATKLLPGSILF